MGKQSTLQAQKISKNRLFPKALGFMKVSRAALVSTRGDHYFWVTLTRKEQSIKYKIDFSFRAKTVWPVLLVVWSWVWVIRVKMSIPLTLRSSKDYIRWFLFKKLFFYIYYWFCSIIEKLYQFIQIQMGLNVIVVDYILLIYRLKSCLKIQWRKFLKKVVR